MIGFFFQLPCLRIIEFFWCWLSSRSFRNFNSLLSSWLLFYSNDMCFDLLWRSWKHFIVDMISVICCILLAGTTSGVLLVVLQFYLPLFQCQQFTRKFLWYLIFKTCQVKLRFRLYPFVFWLYYNTSTIVYSEPD